MKEIKLTKGYVAKVDDEDYDWLSDYSWHTLERGNEAKRRRLREYAVARTAIKIDLGDGRSAYQHVSMHRLIMDASPKEYVDHINGDPLDNRKENLRIVTNQQNSWNARGAKSMNGKPTSSRFKGVFKKICKTPYGDYEYFVSKIKANGKEITVYHGKDEVAAACHYDYAAQNYFGEYARLNFNGAAYDEWYNQAAT
jgi:hypothetical protein